MKLGLLAFLSAFFIVSVYCGKAKSINIPEITAHCSKLVKDLEIKGIDAFVPSEKEAKENMRELSKILKINKIKDKAEKHEKWNEHPELMNLLEKLKKIKVLKKMSESEQEKVLKKNDDMLETVVRLSMLDTTNKKSPIYGKNVKKLLSNKKKNKNKKNAKNAKNKKNKKKKTEKTEKNKKKSLTKKHHKKDGKMKLVCTKVIPPGQAMPDANNINCTGQNGKEYRFNV